jgi:predicted permease
MSNLILLFSCFIAGKLLRRYKRLPDNTPEALNCFIIHVSLPALTLLYIHDLKMGSNVIWVGLMAWLVFGLSLIFFWCLGRWMHLPRATTAGLMLTGGLGNTSFFGLPMVEAYYGKEGLSTAIVASQLGTFLVLSVLGITVAGVYSSGRPGVEEIIKRVAQFPPFIALMLAVILMPVEYAKWFSTLLERLGDTLAPLSLMSVGMQLRLGHLFEHKRELALGLSFKLVLAPLIMFLLYVQLLGAHGQAIQVTLFESAMPPMITASIVASEHNLNPPLVNLMATVGLLLSFVTLGCWWLLLKQV